MSQTDQKERTIVLPEASTAPVSEVTTPVAADQGSPAPTPAPTPANSGMIHEINLRIPLNIAIPILALLGIGVVVLLFGLFLLKLPKEHAPAVALAMAVNIMAATTYAASRKNLNGRTIAELSLMVVYPVLLAVVLVNLGGFGEIEEVAEAAPAAGAEAAAPAPEAVEIVAENLEFTTDELTFPAGEEVALAFDNPDAAPHNVSIYADDSLDESFFIGDNVDPGASITYEIPALEAGAYYFRCDIHPNMAGRVTVE